MFQLSPTTKKLLAPLAADEGEVCRLEANKDLTGFSANCTRVNANGESSYPWRLTNHHIARRMMECTRLATGKLNIPATDTNCLILKNAIPEGHLTCADEETLLLLEQRAASFIYGERAATLQAQYKEGKKPTFTYPAVDGVEYMPHQIYSSACAINNPSYGYFMGTGTGKTLSAIIKLNHEAKIRKDKSKPYRFLIVCPADVQSNWRKELKEFSTCNGKLFQLQGTKLKRIKKFIDACQATDCDWVGCVISYDVVWRMADQLKSATWDCIVTDESHLFKDPSTSRWKGLHKLRDSAKARLCLTATPIVNGPHDLWTQFEFMGEGQSGFHSYKEFKKFYLKMMPAGNVNIVTGVQNVPFLQERLARLAFIVSKEEALKDLPDKTYHIIDIEMSSEQKEAYKKLATEIKLEIENDIAMADSENKTVTVNHVLTRMLRLSQITSGFLKTDAIYNPETAELLAEGSIDRFDPNPKLEKLVELLKKRDHTQKSIVWCCYTQDIKTIAARLKLEGISCVTYFGETPKSEREVLKNAFNNEKEPQVIVGNPECGGIGLNLLGQCDEHTNCDTIFIYSQNWKPAVRAQSEGRNHRKGTRVPVDIVDLCVPYSIDEQIRDRVVNKRITANQIQDLRGTLAKVMECLE